MDTAKLTDEEIVSSQGSSVIESHACFGPSMTANHIAADPAERERQNSDFVKTIELAGKLGVPYIGTQSGKDASKRFEAQVDEIVASTTKSTSPLANSTKCAFYGSLGRAALILPPAR